MLASAAFGGENGTATLVLALCAIVAMIVLLRRQQLQGRAGRELAHDQVARIREEHKLHESMDELLVQLEEVSRQVGAQVDTRFAKLEQVIRDADERIARLEDALGRSEGEVASRPLYGPTVPTTAAAAPLQDSGRAERELPGGTGSSVKPVDPRFERVYELVDAGAPPIEVAERLELPLGEVELILDLRKLR
jgi:hypothetical protein